jgi:hypothetical protein
VPAADQDPYVLFLAPRGAAAVRVGQRGSVLAHDPTAAPVGPGALNAIAAAGSAEVIGDANTRFLDTFVVGDRIQTNGQTRVVVAVRDDQHLSVNLALPTMGAATPYQRLARDRETDLVGTGTVANDAALFRQLIGTGTTFEQMFMAGDRIQATPPFAGGLETRTVVAVLSPTLLLLDLPFSINVPDSNSVPPNPGAVYQRPGRLAQDGFEYAPQDPTALFAGNSVLDRAADLATLMCLGTASRLLSASESVAVVAGAADLRHGAVRQARQVLRNWNLDHRRANEWRMLVGGNAASEKRGSPGTGDVLQPLFAAGAPTPAATGAGTADTLGWTQLLQNWLEVAADPQSDTVADRAARADAPSNLQLSRGLAFLLDLPSPV